MKKCLVFILALLLSFVMVACGANEADGSGSSGTDAEDPVQTEQFTITFIQEGQTIRTQSVNKGGRVDTLPELSTVTGYDFIWDKTLSELSNIQSNTVVTAIKTPKHYTISYESGYELLISDTTEVVYGQSYTLLTPPDRAEFKFVSWTFNGRAVTSDVWNIDGESELTLIAQWEDKISVSFVQDGQETITYYVESGSDFTNIPQVTEKAGYDCSWDKTADDLKDIQEPVTVMAVYNAKTYYVTYQLSEGAVQDSSLTLTDQGKLAIVFDSSFTLGTPEKEGHSFVGYVKIDGTAIESSGDNWSIVENITVVPIFTPKTYVITILLNGGRFGDDFVMGKGNTITVTYGQTYDLGTPIKEKYNFTNWTVNNVEFSKTGIWTYDDDITVNANWQKSENWSVFV